VQDSNDLQDPMVQLETQVAAVHVTVSTLDSQVRLLEPSDQNQTEDILALEDTVGKLREEEAILTTAVTDLVRLSSADPMVQLATQVAALHVTTSTLDSQVRSLEPSDHKQAEDILALEDTAGKLREEEAILTANLVTKLSVVHAAEPCRTHTTPERRPIVRQEAQPCRQDVVSESTPPPVPFQTPPQPCQHAVPKWCLSTENDPDTRSSLTHVYMAKCNDGDLHQSFIRKGLTLRTKADRSICLEVSTEIKDAKNECNAILGVPCKAKSDPNHGLQVFQTARDAKPRPDAWINLQTDTRFHSDGTEAAGVWACPLAGTELVKE